jgi:hypothetical protein
MSYGLPNEALSGCRRTKSSTLMNFHYKTHLNLQSNSVMYMWNQVNYNQSHYANVGTSAPYNHYSYPKVSCPHHFFYKEDNTQGYTGGLGSDIITTTVPRQRC